MPSRPRILAVEDDPATLELTSALLANDADVDCASNTAQALHLMAAADYDLLITDLNIQHAGDGLLLAGAMRCLHPHAHNVLITGYPDYTAALAAIQSTLDLVWIKPLDVDAMRNLPRVAMLPLPRPHHRVHSLSLWQMLESHQEEIMGEWLRLVESDPILKAVPLSPEERRDHMMGLIEGLVAHERDGAERANAKRHGRQRQLQNYQPDWISMEVSYLRRAIFDAVLRRLLELDLSRFPNDLAELNNRLDADLLDSLREFGLQPPR